SAGTQGTLFVVFYGYRLPLGANCPEPLVRSFARPIQPPPRGVPPARVVPFDYAASLGLTGAPFARQETEIAISVDNEFVATAVGYGLATGAPDVTLRLKNPPVDLPTLTLGNFPLDALLDGIRIRPELHRIAFRDSGGLAVGLPVDIVD